MDRKYFFSIALGCIIACFSGFTYAESPVGYWRMIDKTTGKTKGIIQIQQTNAHRLEGKIIKVYANKESSDLICHHCTGDQHNKPLLGMVILQGLESKNSRWHDGHMLDLESGKTYRYFAHMAKNGEELNMWTYQGLPIFGHSQTWERVDLLY